MKALDFLVNLKQSRDFDGNLEACLDEAIAELKAKDEHIKHLQDIYMKLDGKYLKLLEELKENK